MPDGPGVGAHRELVVRLRDLGVDDLAAVLEIERASYPKPWTRGFFEQELATPHARLVGAVGTHPDRPPLAGYSCRWRVTDEVHLLNVAVHPRWRGAGIGRRLVEHVVDEGRRDRARVVFLEVRAGNVVARRLYRRLGFRDLGIRRGYYGPGQDAVVMELRLASGDR